LLAIVLGDPNQLEALRVLVTVELCSECWKAITAVGTLWIGYFTPSASRINYGSHNASFIDSLAQVFLRIPMVRMIRLSRVAS
jgi:hypothetical protein